MSDPILVERGRGSFAAGVVRFRDNLVRGAEPASARIYLPIMLGELSFDAMVDTAAPWCIFDPLIVGEVLPDLEIVEEPVFLRTRLGRFRGSLYRGSVKVLAEEGETLEIEAVIFLSPDWTGGNFIGYLGFLQKIRFAVDPHRNRFYFSSL